MSEYIERYWRDAKPEDAIKEPPMVARFRAGTNQEWVMDTLQGIDRSEPSKWRGKDVTGRLCQVYDAPDPGEGWRLIDPDKDDCNQVGIEFWHTSLRRWEPRPVRFQKTPFEQSNIYRIRIAPPVTYVPFTWEDREQLRGRWITWKHENGLMIESQIDHLNEHKDGGLWFKSHDAKWLLENAKFIDTGKPVGKEVVQ